MTGAAFTKRSKSDTDFVGWYSLCIRSTPQLKKVIYCEYVRTKICNRHTMEQKCVVALIIGSLL